MIHSKFPLILKDNFIVAEVRIESNFPRQLVVNEVLMSFETYVKKNNDSITDQK